MSLVVDDVDSLLKSLSTSQSVASIPSVSHFSLRHFCQVLPSLKTANTLIQLMHLHAFCNVQCACYALSGCKLQAVTRDTRDIALSQGNNYTNLYGSSFFSYVGILIFL